MVVSYTTVSRWEFRKTGAEGAVIDGIPPSFERVQLFIVDRYTVFRSCGPIRQVSPLPEGSSTGGEDVEETREEWCRRSGGRGRYGSIPRAKLPEIFDGI